MYVKTRYLTSASETQSQRGKKYSVRQRTETKFQISGKHLYLLRPKNDMDDQRGLGS